ncbi:MAG: DEAD/DEAH box helicase, partial [Streptosporangiaceae bacterium]
TYDGPLPAGLVEAGPIGTRELRERLRDLGDRVVREGIGGTDAATALLLRRPPETDGPAGAEGETAAEAAIRLATSLRRSYLPLQGPPGTGKTYTAAEQILALVAQGRTAGITGPSHAVIEKLIDTVCQRAGERGRTLRIGQKPDQEGQYLHAAATEMPNERLERKLRDGELDVAAGSVWLWAREGMAGSVDTLFVDEAGQLSLANVLAVAGAARNLVLLGDPQQLAQPSQATHPPGAGASALGHILGERATMPEGAGRLLDQTYRMHPDLCRYTSEVFYDGKLLGVDGLGRQEILGDGLFSGSGLRVVEVPHEGNTNASPEEADEVARLAELLAGCSWRDRGDVVRPVGRDGILIVTPYNAQIRAIQEALRGRGLTGAALTGLRVGLRVGTVDKFQGREAPVVIYSMATSSADEAPRGLDFLYDRHRLNVATSRARAMAIIVASPDLIRVSCRTPHQMTLANALCRAWEEPAG